MKSFKLLATLGVLAALSLKLYVVVNIHIEVAPNIVVGTTLILK